MKAALPIAETVVGITGAPPGVGLGLNVLDKFVQAKGPITVDSKSFVEQSQKIGSALSAALRSALPVIEQKAPTLASIVSSIPDNIMEVEALLPQDGQGPAKQAHVAAQFKADLAMGLVQELLATLNPPMKVNYDEALLLDAIDKFAAAYNALANLKGSIKLGPVA